MTKRNRWMSRMTQAARSHAETGPTLRALKAARAAASTGRGDLLAASG